MVVEILAEQGQHQPPAAGQPDQADREQAMTDITEDDRRRAIRIAEKYVGAYEGLSSLTSAIAIALAETRERADAPLRQAQILLDDAQKDHARIAELEDAEGIRWARMNARIAELQAKLEASRDCSGRYHKRIAKLEAENARLRKRLAIFQRNAGLATTEATP